MVPASTGAGSGSEASSCDSQPRCCERYAGYYEVISCRESRRSDSLLLLYEGDGAGIFKYGFLSGNRRSRNLQKRKEAEGSRGIYADGADGFRDRLSLSFACSKPW